MHRTRPDHPWKQYNQCCMSTAHETAAKNRIEWALSNGMLLRTINDLTHVPFVLEPTPIDAALRDRAAHLQTLVNRLVFRLSMDDAAIEHVIGR